MSNQQNNSAGPQSDPNASPETVNLSDFQIFNGDFDDFGKDAPDHSDPPEAEPSRTGDQPVAPAAPEPSGTTSKPDEPGAPDAPAAGAEPPPAHDGPPPGADENKFRHKTHADAEAAYEWAIKGKTRADMEAARLKKELDQILQVRKAEETARQKKTFRAAQYAAAEQKLEDLDPEATDYIQQRARVFAERDDAIEAFEPDLSDFEAPAGDGGPEGDSLPSASDLVPDTLDLPGTSAPVPPAASDPVSPEAAANMRLALKNRLDARTDIDFGMDDPMFQYFASRAPAIDDAGNPLPFDQQVDWAANQARQHYDLVHKRRLQVHGQPLQRSGPGTPDVSASEQNEEPLSLGDAIDAAAQARVIA